MYKKELEGEALLLNGEEWGLLWNEKRLLDVQKKFEEGVGFV